MAASRDGQRDHHDEGNRDKAGENDRSNLRHACSEKRRQEGPRRQKPRSKSERHTDLPFVRVETLREEDVGERQDEPAPERGDRLRGNELRHEPGILYVREEARAARRCFHLLLGLPRTKHQRRDERKKPQGQPRERRPPVGGHLPEPRRSQKRQEACNQAAYHGRGGPKALGDGKQVHPLCRLAVLVHEGRLAHVMERREERPHPGRHQQHAAVGGHDVDEAQGGAHAVSEDERGLAPNSVGNDPRGHARHCPEDPGDEQAKSDEAHVEADRQQVEVEDYGPRAVDHVHPDDVDDVEPSVSAEHADRGRVTGLP